MTYSLLFLKNFNNYFNRTVKRLEAVSDYLDAVDSDGSASFAGINFVPGDGVSTTQVMNWVDKWLPDYLVVSYDAGEIDSRWYVVESKRLRNGQYQFTLKRDTVADFLEQIGNAKAYVVRGTLSADNPLIYNPEGISFNQVKKNEYIIGDQSSRYTNGLSLPSPFTRIPSKYVVGYFGRDNFREATEITVSAGSSSVTPYETIKTPIDDWQKDYLNKVQYIRPSGTDVRLIVSAKAGGRSGTFDYFCVSPYTSVASDGSEQSIPGVDLSPLNDTSLVTDSRGPGWTGWDLAYYGGSGKGDGFALAKTILRQTASQSVVLSEVASEKSVNLVNLSDINALLAYNNKIIEDSKGDKYRITAQIEGASWKLYTLLSNGAAANLIQTKKIFGDTTFPTVKGATFSWDQWDIFSTKTFNNSSVAAILNLQRFTLKYEPVSDTYKTTIPATASRRHCTDSAFDIFVIPVSHADDLAGRLPIAVSIGQEILAQTNGTKDLQLLPFSPIQDRWSDGELIDPDAAITTSAGTSSGSLSIFFANTSQASFHGFINRATDGSPAPASADFAVPSDPVELKVANETNLFRLCAPNYSAIFEFSPYKNGGLDTEAFDVDCAFKPFQPYIHVAPHFGGLYGEDFNDVRGLTLVGNFSLDQYTDAWATYELNNKNYQLTFDRQIDSLELSQDLQRVQQVFTSVAGSVQGASMGAIAGATIGGPVGAVVGGVIGGVTSAAAGVADWAMLAMSQADQINASRAYFSNSLGNIKAIPHTVSKVSAYNPNNKVWPIIEKYSATDTEKDLFRNLLESRSMTVGAVTDIGPFIHPDGDRKWLQCQPIRLEGLSEDSHIANDIYQELAKGVYI